MTTEIFTWQDFDEAVEYLTAACSGLSVEDIYALPRGGLPLGVALSHQLAKPMISRVTDVSRDTLIVDDISDTGKTLQIFANVGLTIITIHYVKGASVIPHFYYKERAADWVIYPWEKRI